MIFRTSQINSLEEKTCRVDLRSSQFRSSLNPNGQAPMLDIFLPTCWCHCRPLFLKRAGANAKYAFSNVQVPMQDTISKTCSCQSMLDTTSQTCRCHPMLDTTSQTCTCQCRTPFVIRGGVNARKHLLTLRLCRKNRGDAGRIYRGAT